MAKKLGFALGAGGSRGVAHVGFLKAMEENGIKPDYISGTSMGAVVGSCYALGMTADQMMEEVDNLKTSEIFDLSLNPLGNGALMRAKKVRKKMESYLGKTKFKDLKIPFNCVAVDLISGQKCTFNKNDYVIDGVVASLSIPGVFKASEYKHKRLIDGGIICRVPVQEVRDLGAQVIVAVDVLGDVRASNRKHNLLGVIFRMEEIMEAKINEYQLKEQNPDLILLPELGDMSQFKFKNLRFAYEMGYKIGIENADKIKKLLI